MKKIAIVALARISFSMPKIHFIYNANNDFFSVAGDFFHKSLWPKTYPCDLCKLSYGIINKKKQWTDFLQSLDYDYSFVYKNEDHPILRGVQFFPVILFESNNNVEILVSRQELNICNNLDELIKLIKIKISKY